MEANQNEEVIKAARSFNSLITIGAIVVAVHFLAPMALGIAETAGVALGACTLLWVIGTASMAMTAKGGAK